MTAKSERWNKMVAPYHCYHNEACKTKNKEDILMRTLGRNVGFTGKMAVFEGKTRTG